MGKIASNFISDAIILNFFCSSTSHNDFPLAIRELFNNDLNGFDFNSDLSKHSKFENYPYDHTDLPRLRKGQVGGQVLEWLLFYNSTFTE